MMATEAINPRNSLARSFWQRLPVVIRAVVTGLLAAAAGTIPWALMVSANLRHWSVVPWSVLPAALYLWFYWQYVRGAGWPRSTADTRRMSCRANLLSGDVWGTALLAGILGLVTLVLFLRVMNRLARLPAQPTDDLSHVPFVTLIGLLLMASVVAGVVEEVSFRGYMQGPIERRHGPIVAILVTGSLFGFMHFTHPEVGMILMPYYIAVATVYGTLAYFTNSILPSMVLHGCGNALGYLDLLTRGRAEWQTPSSPSPLIWETGVDAKFWISCLAVLIVATGTVGAYIALARVARRGARTH